MYCGMRRVDRRKLRVKCAGLIGTSPLVYRCHSALIYCTMIIVHHHSVRGCPIDPGETLPNDYFIKMWPDILQAIGPELRQSRRALLNYDELWMPSNQNKTTSIGHQATFLYLLWLLVFRSEPSIELIWSPANGMSRLFRPLALIDQNVNNAQACSLAILEATYSISAFLPPWRRCRAFITSSGSIHFVCQQRGQAFVKYRLYCDAAK